MKRILVINPFGIGDVLFSTPLLKALKKKYPDSAVTYICNRRAYGVIKNNPSISNIYIFEKDDYRNIWKESKIRCLKAVFSLFSKLKKDKYDIAIDMSLGYLSNVCLHFFVGIPVLVGFNYRKRGKFLSHKVDIDGFNAKHVIEYYLDFGRLLGLDVSDKNMELIVPEVDIDWAGKYLSENGIRDTDKVCGFIPGCGASWGSDAYYRRWSPWKFAQAADHIVLKHGYKVIIFGEEKEKPMCIEMQSKMKSTSLQLCGKTTLDKFAALLKRCDLVVTNDGGPLHMAVALKRHTISIFGPVNEKIYGPYPFSGIHATVTSNDVCRPCYSNFKHSDCSTIDCLKHVTPKEVISCIDNMVRQIR